MDDSHGRIELWDNLKFLLILSVVAGHFVSQYLTADTFRMVWIFIYAFHMPAFIFISGCFHRNRNVMRKAAAFVCLGLVYKIIIFAVRSIFDSDVRFELLSESGAPWYLFALAAFIIISYLLRDVDPRLVLVVSILTACFAGYDTSINDHLCLSRIIVFFPFYHAGVMADERSLAALAGKRSLKVLGAAILIVWAVLCILKGDALFSLNSLFAGQHPFKGSFIHFGFLWRLCCYAISAVLCAALIFAAPTRHIPIVSEFGQRTVQVYFWHRPVLYVISGLGIPAAMCASPAGKIAYLLIAVALTLLLSLKVFSFPTSQILRR